MRKKIVSRRRCNAFDDLSGVHGSGDEDDDYNASDTMERKQKRQRIDYIRRRLEKEAKLESKSTCTNLARLLYDDEWAKLSPYNLLKQTHYILKTAMLLLYKRK